MDYVKVLVTSSPMISHFAPLVPFVEALRDGGHDLLLLAPREVLERAAQLGVPTREGGAPDQSEADGLWRRLRAAEPSEASVIANREIFARLNTAAMLPLVEETVGEYRPDLVLHEVTEYAGPFAASRAAIPHAQVAISLAKVEDGSLRIAQPVLEQYGPLLAALRAAPFLTRFPAAIDPSPYPDTRRYRETAQASKPLPVWGRAEDPLVYVTFGTVAAKAGSGIYRAAVEALAPLPVRVLVTTGSDMDDMDLGPVPDNVLVRRWVDQADVLAEAAMVLCHGGSGTTLGALGAGVPAVIFPMFADQRHNAVELERLGVARIVEPSGQSASERAEGTAETADRLRAATQAVLGDETMRAAARNQAAVQANLPTPAQLLAGLLGAHPHGR